MERNNSHKVGVKIFSEAQLENVLPTYPNLFHKISACREAALAELHSDEKRHYQYNFMYDNVFSILGKRGTGKTSVVFTLQKMIRERYGKKYHDIVLPLIIPEAIPDNCSVLGWILAIVKEEVKRLEDGFEQRRKESESPYWNKCAYMAKESKEASLSEKLDILSQLFYAGNYNPSNEASYYRAIDNSVAQTIDYYMFAQGIADFWDAWIKEIRHRYKPEDGEEEICPLIYFIFDDVDLAPEKIDELLSVIIKYLSHPNIIVLTTADEELFLEVIENRLDRNIGRLPREWRNYLSRYKSAGNTKYIMWPSEQKKTEERAAEDMVSQTTRMYLGKVLPSSTRYYLRLFHTAKQKEAFCLEDGLSLGEGVTKQVQLLIDAVGKKQSVNFMNPKMVMINFYLKFMGNTSRQIANVYIALQELVCNLISVLEMDSSRQSNREAAITSIYQNSRYFLTVAVRANHELAELIGSVDDFVDELFLPEYNQWKLYINYAFIDEYIKKNLSEDKKQHKIEIGLQLYAMAAFQENLLLIMERGLSEGITNRKKVHVVRFLTRYIEHVAFNERHIFRDDLEPNVFLQHYINLLDRLPVIISDEMSVEKFNMEYFYNFNSYQHTVRLKEDGLMEIHRNNRQYFDELVGMMAMVYGNAYLFDSKDMENCIIYPPNECYTRDQIVIQEEIKNNIYACFGLMKMQEGWNERGFYLKRMKGNTPPDDRSGFYILVKKIKSLYQSKGLIPLSQIISKVVEICKERTKNPLEENPFRYCPEEIIREVLQLTHVMTGSDVILGYAQKIRTVRQSIVRRGFLFDPDNMVSVLMRLTTKGYFGGGQISPILYSMQNRDSSKTGYIEIPKKIYFELSRILTNALKSGMAQDDSYDDNNISEEEIKEVLANIDIGISLQEDEEVSAAVRLGLQILIMEYLQSGYIYETISKRYESDNNLSSKGLEHIAVGTRKQPAYYYQLFEQIVELQEKRALSADKYRDDYKETDDMWDDIMTVCTRERQQYVDFLIQGEKNG